MINYLKKTRKSWFQFMNKHSFCQSGIRIMKFIKIYKILGYIILLTEIKLSIQLMAHFCMILPLNY